MELKTLNALEVLQIHEALTIEFAASGDPISPPGVRSIDLLESAVARQLTGHGEVLKCSDPIDNVSTLLYGICCNHPFYNGNKRTALVAMLVHLDKNKRSFFDTTQKQLYDFMIEVADHRLVKTKKKHTDESERPQSDEEVAAISKWTRERVRSVKRGEKLITYRELRRILESFKYYLENPHGNSIDIVRYETVKRGLIRRREETIKKRVGNMSWPGEGHEVALNEIKTVREICRLREEDGVDSESFYNYAVVVDSFVNRYRTTLRRLAKA